MTRVKAIYRSWAIPCSGKQVYGSRHRAEWLHQLARRAHAAEHEHAVGVRNLARDPRAGLVQLVHAILEAVQAKPRPRSRKKRLIGEEPGAAAGCSIMGSMWCTRPRI